MGFIAPMLAAPMPKELKLTAGQYVAEEKFDGIRLVVEVTDAAHDDLLSEGKKIVPWSRLGNIHPLPQHIIDALQHLPYGIYDGELRVPGKRSYGVVELVNGPDLIYTIFDVIQASTVWLADKHYEIRRGLLEGMFRLNKSVQGVKGLELSHIWPIITQQDVTSLCNEVWARDGEGIILKRINSVYNCGGRPKDAWIKIKKLQSAVLTCIGFEAGKLGPYARVLLRDNDGNITTVKTRNNMELGRLEMRALAVIGPHPDIGRRMRIEFQERTPDGNYRHPRWDRWEDE